jgi:hypothetical protein
MHTSRRAVRWCESPSSNRSACRDRDASGLPKGATSRLAPAAQNIICQSHQRRSAYPSRHQPLNPAVYSKYGKHRTSLRHSHPVPPLSCLLPSPLCAARMTPASTDSSRPGKVARTRPPARLQKETGRANLTPHPPPPAAPDAVHCDFDPPPLTCYHSCPDFPYLLSEWPKTRVNREHALLWVKLAPSNLLVCCLMYR